LFRGIVPCDIPYWVREAKVGICAADCKHDVNLKRAKIERGCNVDFLIDVLWAVLMVGVPIALFTLALVYWVLQRGHFSEAENTRALQREIKIMSKNKKKKKGEKNGGKASAEDVIELHPLQKKWTRFGGGFYGIVAFFTYIVVELGEIFSVIMNFGGLFDFLKQLNVDLLIRILIDALMNFVTAITWPVYWMQRIETSYTWVWFLVAYAGYWLGLKLAQMLVQRRSQVAT
jgi:hypothetical protein